MINNSLRQFLQILGADPIQGVKRLVSGLDIISLRSLIDLNQLNIPLGDLHSPVIRYIDAKGYEYDETSDWWKELCSDLPCFEALQWPDYSTDVIHDVINGRKVIIQLWKGWCPKFLGLKNFPGGIGAEIGIYENKSGRELTSDLSFLPAELKDKIREAIDLLPDKLIWWPITDPRFLKDMEIEFEIINPKSGNTLFNAGPQKNTYWLCKWMTDNSYTKYKQYSKTPKFSVNYILKYKINGKEYPIW